jgi:hypothetical protein
MAPPEELIHDRGLFETLLAEMHSVAPDLRSGAMFGCPAAYIGTRLAFCVYGDVVGVKLPAAAAARLMASGKATAFRPYGRVPMKEWVELRVTRATAAAAAPVLAVAIDYARNLEEG